MDFATLHAYLATPRPRAVLPIDDWHPAWHSPPDDSDWPVPDTAGQDAFLDLPTGAVVNMLDRLPPCSRVIAAISAASDMLPMLATFAEYDPGPERSYLFQIRDLVREYMATAFAGDLLALRSLNLPAIDVLESHAIRAANAHHDILGGLLMGYPFGMSGPGLAAQSVARAFGLAAWWASRTPTDQTPENLARLELDSVPRKFFVDGDYDDGFENHTRANYREMTLSQAAAGAVLSAGEAATSFRLFFAGFRYPIFHPERTDRGAECAPVDDMNRLCRRFVRRWWARVRCRLAVANVTAAEFA